MSEAVTPDAEQLGNRVGKYQLQGEIGQGRMGTVYVAYDPTLDRKVAVKVLAPHLVCEPPFVESFRRELRSAARLDHPNIVTLHDAGRKEGRCYYVMNYIEGQPLDEVIRERAPLPAKEALDMLRPLAEALDYAHGRGMLHGDIKPGNVIVAPEGRVTLTDFAIARAVEGTWLTRWGVVVGTPEYMSPEQAMGQKIDARSDQYSLGVLGYEMLTGRAPFEGASNVQLVHQVVYEAPPPLAEARPDLPPAAVHAINRVLAKDPAKRFRDCGAFVHAFGESLGLAAEREVVYVSTPAAPAPEPAPEPVAKEPPLVAAPVATVAAVPAPAVEAAGTRPEPAPPVVEPAAPIAAPDWKQQEIEAVRAAKAAATPADVGSATPVTPALLGIPSVRDEPKDRKRRPRAERAAPSRAIPPVREAEVKRPRLPAWARVLAGLGVVVILLGVGGYLAYIYGFLPAFLVPYARMILPPVVVSYDDRMAGTGAEGTPTPTPMPTPTPIPIPTTPADALVPPAGAAAGKVWTRPADAMAMVFVPAGEFAMGSDLGADDEQPVHAVALDAFWIDETEVTNTQYRWCVESGNCSAPTTCDFGAAPYEDVTLRNHPAVCVDWEGAQAYCEWAGGRLPTEAEWEYAARGPAASVYPWGDIEPSCMVARYAACDQGTAEVGEMPDGASWVGALDMAGNVWEWVADRYARKYYDTSPGENPTGPEAGSDRVLRGGGWYFDDRYMRSAGRYKLPPVQRLDYVGFRCVYVPEAETEAVVALKSSPTPTPTPVPSPTPPTSPIATPA